MACAPSTDVQYLKGVGPQRALLLAERGIRTIEDLLGYLPFRYEDRIHFAQIRDVRPGGIYTLQAVVLDGAPVAYGRPAPNFRRRRADAIYHLLVRDASGSLACKFFHGGYLADRFKSGKRLVLHGRAELDKYHPGRVEMVNPEFEILSSDSADSTEVGRIVPIYESIAKMSSRTLRGIIYSALGNLSGALPDFLPPDLLARYRFPSREDAIRFVHFPSQTESVDALNAFRSPAHQRLIFEEFFFYQLSVALRRQRAQQQKGIAFRVREPQIREALKRILPFKPTGAQKRALGEIAADLERPDSDESSAAGRRRLRQDDRRARSGDHRHRKRLPGGADGADGNSRRAALSGRAARLRALRLSRRVAGQRHENRAKSATPSRASRAAKRNSSSARTR